MNNSHGALLRAEIDKLGRPVSRIAKELNISRAWLYQLFDKEKFSKKDMDRLKPIFPYELSKIYLTPVSESMAQEPEQTIHYWRDKYYQLLEDHLKLLQEVKK